MNALIHGLELVSTGITEFPSPNIEDEGYAAFQAMAEALIEAKDAKLLYEVAVQRSMSRASYGHVERVLVAGGLTPKAKEFLSTVKDSSLELIPSHTSSVEKEPEIFQLRPTFAGMSIDLKALWKKYQPRRVK